MSDSSAEDEVEFDVADPLMDDFRSAFGRSGKKKYEDMLHWRAEHRVDSILQRSHPKFFVFKEAYPFFIHGAFDLSFFCIVAPVLSQPTGHTRAGELVTYELPGRMNIASATREGVDQKVVRELFTCIHEYITQVVRSQGHAQVGSCLLTRFIPTSVALGPDDDYH